MLINIIDGQQYTDAVTVAQKLNCSAAWVRMLANDKKLSYVKQGGRLWFPLDEEGEVDFFPLPRKKSCAKVNESLFKQL